MLFVQLDNPVDDLPVVSATRDADRQPANDERKRPPKDFPDRLIKITDGESLIPLTLDGLILPGRIDAHYVDAVLVLPRHPVQLNRPKALNLPGNPLEQALEIRPGHHIRGQQVKQRVDRGMSYPSGRR